MRDQTCAIVGLGLIGNAWARHLEHDGVLTATWNRTPKDFAHFEQSLETIPAKASIIHIVVSDELVTSSVVERLAPSLNSTHLIIQSTTIDPSTSSKVRSIVEQRGARYLEAPFTGSLPGALSRKTLFYLGGSEQVIIDATPYLQRLSERQIHIGSNEQACVLKLALNLQIAAAATALAEALSVCRTANIEDDVFFHSLAHNSAHSQVAVAKEPLLRARDFSPQFSTKHMKKDMRLLGLCAPNGFRLLDSVLKTLQASEDAGHGEEDFSSLIKLYERN
jgi:3-hydroxyisobutyrate dehydrogenase